LFTNFEIMVSKSKVYFFFDNVRISLRDRTKLKQSIELLFKKEKKFLVSLNYIFCSDKRMLYINWKYLKHDFYTDIITFDLSEEKNKIVGEIYISVDRVLENSTAFKKPFSKELSRVIFHGALHLCGYKDKTNKQKRQIRKREDYYISQIIS
jgi:probable rRNA maturation factor